MLAAAQGIEAGDAVNARHHDFAVDHELPVVQGALNDARVAGGPVVAAARDQPRAVAFLATP